MIEVRRINDRMMSIKFIIGRHIVNVVSVVSAYVVKNGTSLLNFAKVFELENHLVTFCNTVVKTLVDYLLLRKNDRGLCKDFKVISSENIFIKDRLCVMDLKIKRDMRKKALYDLPKI